MMHNKFRVFVCSSTLRLQKRLASAVMKCGKNKVWLDPNETNEINNANSSKFYSVDIVEVLISTLSQLKMSNFKTGW